MFRLHVATSHEFGVCMLTSSGLRRPAIASVLVFAPQHSVLTQRACQNSNHLWLYLTLQIGSY